MTDLREHTLEEANALVPALHRLVSRQMVVQSQLEDVLRIIHELTGELPREIAPRGSDDDVVRARKEDAVALLKRFEEGWAEVAALGVAIKDPRVGLVDVLGRVDGEAVWLCWRFGEESITHYHALDEGFSGRKPIPGGAVRHRLLS
jgi:hypothetical protein